ncbi:prephenate dehydratase [Amycolatopsis cihanbeyliensis]|uniref:prephenate dehydratase n=1 Tax=Amycolatopsis cihanbeyliensis TaxID=1128664 RepID=UPI00115108C5|nr:prephenate dehydratase [Amycolatopsis cihanbeyliensis]
MPVIAYFGPQGTFTEQAARGLIPDGEFLPAETIFAALNAVRDGRAEAACVPVENSVEGPVNATLDGLTESTVLVAVAETILPVQFSVLVRQDASDIRTVASHPHALAQVRQWLATNLPEAEQVPTSSTAAAAQAVRRGEYDAAVTASVAAQHYELREFVGGIADLADASTRFLLVRRPGRLPEPTGADRTSLMAVTVNRTGALAELLTELSFRGINLTRLDARPAKTHIGQYRFFVDMEGHIAEPRIGDAVAALRRRCSVRFLGSHPRADHAPSSGEPPVGNEDFVAATNWLESVRRGESV